MVCFDGTPPLEAVAHALSNAVAYRRRLFADKQTTAYRLVNGEGDSLPGLIVDCYDRVLVIQISTLGMDRLKTFVLQWLQENFQPTSIYEKSESPSRTEEGLKKNIGFHSGEKNPIVDVIENGLKFRIDVIKGQKTGFFCDHREMRALIGRLAGGKSVLNCFAYSGGFTVYALAGGAKRVDTVEISETALRQAKENVELNGLPSDPESYFPADVFGFLREKALPDDRSLCWWRRRQWIQCCSQSA